MTQISDDGFRKFQSQKSTRVRLDSNNNKNNNKTVRTSALVIPDRLPAGTPIYIYIYIHNYIQNKTCTYVLCACVFSGSRNAQWEKV